MQMLQFRFHGYWSPRCFYAMHLGALRFRRNKNSSWKAKCECHMDI